MDIFKTITEKTRILNTIRHTDILTVVKSEQIVTGGSTSVKKAETRKTEAATQISL